MAKQPKPGEWSYTVGEIPVELTAYERAERGLAIYTRVWDGAAIGKRKKLCGPIRTKAGRIDPILAMQAQQSAIERQKAIATGIDMEQDGPLTLAVGFRKMLDKKEGKFAAESDWKKAVKRYPPIIVEALGDDLLWRDVKHLHYRKLWRWIADEFNASKRFGPREAEKIVGFLRSAARWLQLEGLIEPGEALPAPGWQQTLKTEWTEKTGNPVLPPNKPRYSEDENRRLWAALPKADPRLRIAVEIGAELRLGQVPRSRRTDVLPHGEHEVGKVRVHGRGKKLGETPVLDPSARIALERALTDGYLKDLESAYRAGTIADYFLIPGGKLLKGFAQLKHAGRMWDKDGGLRKAWKKLETAAKIDHVSGRDWYGLRRLSADLAEDVTSDARELNVLGGWSSTKTRENYQQKGRADIAERARDVREKIRPRNESYPEKFPQPENAG